MLRVGLIVISLFTGCGIAIGESQTSASVSFDSQRAWNHLLRQVEFGPRIPSSLSIQQTREYMLKQLADCGFSTGTQSFTGFSQALNRNISGLNVWGALPENGKIRYLFSAHYDSRPIADRDPDPANHKTPIAAANDGASGVAVILEIARVCAARKGHGGVAVALFDAEDHGVQGNSGFCLGSRYMASNLPDPIRFEVGINLDMIGEKGVQLMQEQNSRMSAPETMDRIWELGTRKYPAVFLTKPGLNIYDDHMPFIEAGMKYVDLIDIEYPYWHTVSDTPDKCSPESLKAVGDVLVELLYP